MTKLMLALLAAGAGAGTMYLTDPVRGRARRSVLRDKVRSWQGDVAETFDKGFRDLLNHGRGLAAEVRHTFAMAPVSDDILVDRIRSRIGRVVSHPHAIEIKPHHGTVTLSGPVLSAELDELLRTVRHTPGVHALDCQLNIHMTRDIPALQGGKERVLPAFTCDPSAWTPGVRMLTGLAGGTLALTGLARRGVLGAAMVPLGVSLLIWGFAEPHAYARGRRHAQPQPEPLATESDEESVTSSQTTSPAL